MSISTAAWNGAASRFSDEEWAHSCILDMGDCSAASKQATAKERFKLPIREPNGSINAHALGSAAGALAGSRTPLQACPAAKAAAARKLRAAYGEAKLEVPESLAA